MGKFNWVIARFVRFCSHSGVLMFATLTSTVLIILPPSPQPHTRFQWNYFLSCFHLQKNSSCYLLSALTLKCSVIHFVSTNRFSIHWIWIFSFTLESSPHFCIKSSHFFSYYQLCHETHDLFSSAYVFFSVLFACPRAHDVNLWVLFSELLHSNDNIELRKKTSHNWPGLAYDVMKAARHKSARIFLLSSLPLLFAFFEIDILRLFKC